MPLMNLELDVTHHNALLNAYADASDLGEARRGFQMFEDDGTQLDACLCGDYQDSRDDRINWARRGYQSQARMSESFQSSAWSLLTS
jgi:hypothetical protein